MRRYEIWYVGGFLRYRVVRIRVNGEWDETFVCTLWGANRIGKRWVRNTPRKIV
jgi:hypothetical protein